MSISVGISLIVTKMVKSHFKRFKNVWRRYIEISVRRVYQIKSNLIIRGKEK